MKYIEDTIDALKELDKNDNVRVIIITGNEQAFAAGADIKQMADFHRYSETVLNLTQALSVLEK